MDALELNGWAKVLYFSYFSLTSKLSDMLHYITLWILSIKRYYYA